MLPNRKDDEAFETMCGIEIEALLLGGQIGVLPIPTEGDQLVLQAITRPWRVRDQKLFLLSSVPGGDGALQENDSSWRNSSSKELSLREQGSCREALVENFASTQKANPGLARQASCKEACLCKTRRKVHVKTQMYLQKSGCAKIGCCLSKEGWSIELSQKMRFQCICLEAFEKCMSQVRRKAYKRWPLSREKINSCSEETSLFEAWRRIPQERSLQTQNYKFPKAVSSTAGSRVPENERHTNKAGKVRHPETH